MPQGKLKVKATMPKGVQKKGKAILKRNDRSGPKKAKPITEKQKIKASLEKSIRARIEDEMRSRVSHGDGRSTNKKK